MIYIYVRDSDQVVSRVAVEQLDPIPSGYTEYTDEGYGFPFKWHLHKVIRNQDGTYEEPIFEGNFISHPIDNDGLL
jgi:hypothetical protein